MEKKIALGILTYYSELPFGEKDSFARKVADAIGVSTASARRKILNSSWRKTELPVVNQLIPKS